MSQNKGKARGFNNIRVQSYPSLEGGNDAFPRGRYEIDHKEIDQKEMHDHSFILQHKLHNAHLIQRLINEEKAIYACAIASPRSMYRTLLKSSKASQTISWEPENFGEAPYFTPMIVCIKEVSLRLDSDRDEVHEIWQGAEITFPKGARLAQAAVMQCRAAGISGMLSIQSDDKLEKGQFFVEMLCDDDLRFVAHCHPDLHSFLKSGEDRTKRIILTHIATACFVRLQKGESEKGVDYEAKYPSLRAFSKQMKEMKCGHWSDDDFRPEEAATALYPLQIERDVD